MTFRTADSIPAKIWKGLCEESKEWRELISRSFEKNDGDIPESLRERYEQFQRRYQARLEKTLDRCSGRCLLRNPANRGMVAETLKHFHGARYALFAAVIMPNHCHVIIRPREGFELEKVVGTWKSFSSRRIHSASSDFWQAESFDRIIRDESHFRKAVKYVFSNPFKANLSAGESWLWSTDVVHPLIENPRDDGEDKT